jgi:hypothetical protein
MGVALQEGGLLLGENAGIMMLVDARSVLDDVVELFLVF